MFLFQMNLLVLSDGTASDQYLLFRF